MRVIRRDEIKRTFFWVCDNGETYETSQLAGIIGISHQALLQRTAKHGPLSPELFRKAKKRWAGRVLTCDVGEIVIHKGKKVWVSEVYCRGFEDRECQGTIIPGERAYLIVCRILPDRLNPEGGQILKNSPFLIADDWVHEVYATIRRDRNPARKVTHLTF
jgi:hypothetical protein